jgi:hypothetical protein
MSRSKYGAINVQPSRCTVWDGIKTIDRTVIFIYDDTVIFGGYVIGLPLGLVYANAMEWGIHKYILHGRKLGKKRGTFWSFHFHRHHRQSRQNAFHDPDYREPLGQSWNGQAKEAAALVALSIAHLPLDHHMALNQDANWCITRPWMDDWMGTREPYVGTERERRDQERRAAS